MRPDSLNHISTNYEVTKTQEAAWYSELKQETKAFESGFSFLLVLFLKKKKWISDFICNH